MPSLELSTTDRPSFLPYTMIVARVTLFISIPVLSIQGRRDVLFYCLTPVPISRSLHSDDQWSHTLPLMRVFTAMRSSQSFPYPFPRMLCTLLNFLDGFHLRLMTFSMIECTMVKLMKAVIPLPETRLQAQVLAGVKVNANVSGNA